MGTEQFKEDRLVFRNNYNPMLDFETAEKIAAYFGDQKAPLDLQDEKTFLDFFYQVRVLEYLIHTGQQVTPDIVQGIESKDKAEDEMALRAKAVAEDYFEEKLTPRAPMIQALLYAYVLIEKIESDKRFWAERKQG